MGMSERVRFEQDVYQDAGGGEFTVASTTIVERWAGVLIGMSSEAMETGRLTSKATATFVIRFDAETRMITPTGWRLIFNGQTYNIKSALDLKQSRQFITVQAVLGEAA